MGNVISSGKSLICCGADPVILDPPDDDSSVSDQSRHESPSRRSTSPSMRPRTASVDSFSSSLLIREEDLPPQESATSAASGTVGTRSAAYTACGTVGARVGVYRDVPEWESRDALRNDVEAYVRDQLAKAAGRKAVVIVGEHHRSITSVLVELVALATVHRLHGQGCVLMLEDEPPNVRMFVADVVKKLDSAMPEHAGGDSANEADKLFDDKLRRSPSADAQRTWHQAFNAYLAQRLGFEVTGFDTRRALPHEDNLSAPRELGMVGAIQGQLSTDAPTVVIAGRHHLPVLHEALTSEAHVIALAGVFFPRSNKNPVANERESYLFAHPDLMRFRTDNSGTEFGRFEFVQFAKELGIDLSRQTEAAEQSR